MSSISLGVLKDSVLTELRARCVSPETGDEEGPFPSCKDCGRPLSGSKGRRCAFSIKLGLSETRPWDWRFPEGQTLSPHPTGGSLKAGHVSHLFLCQGRVCHRIIPQGRAG